MSNNVLPRMQWMPIKTQLNSKGRTNVTSSPVARTHPATGSRGRTRFPVVVGSIFVLDGTEVQKIDATATLTLHN